MMSSVEIYRVTPLQKKKNRSHKLFYDFNKNKASTQNVFSLVDQDMLVNTMVPIFHAQNLLHILKKKKRKARIKFMNFSQKYMGSVFFLGGGRPVFLCLFAAFAYYVIDRFVSITT